MQITDALALRPKSVVAAVGAGGKTTILQRLAADLAAEGAGVVSTTTTNIWEPDGACLIELDEAALLVAVGRRIRRGQALTVAAGRRMALDEHSGLQRAKLSGIAPTMPGRLLAIPGVDYVLVEADGARGRAIKAPATHEPVMPPDAHCVLLCAGIDAVGRPLNEQIAHRPERVAELLGTPLETPVSTSMLAALLAHPQGGLKDIPHSARCAVVLNKVQDPAGLRSARAVAALLRGRPGIERILIAAAQAPACVLEVW